MKIRPAKLQDCPACQQICNAQPELIGPSGYVSLWWIKSFVEENQIFFVAEKDKQIVGFIFGERLSGNLALIWEMAVRPEYRNAGIGSKLFGRTEKECRKRKINAIMLYGYAGNPGTLKFFEKHGCIRGSATYEFIKMLEKIEVG